MFDWFYTCKKYREVRQLISRDVGDEIVLPEPVLPEMALGKALRKRRSKRKFGSNELDVHDLSNLLWCANGVNMELDDTKVLHTAPTASNHQEIDLYLIDANGGYKYNSIKHSLTQLFSGDVRAYVGQQKFVESAPVIVCVVADYSRMVKHNWQKKKRYSCIDAGYVSQNIYLYCASAKLSTVACGKINRKLIAKILGITNCDVMLCHPIG